MRDSDNSDANDSKNINKKQNIVKQNKAVSVLLTRFSDKKFFWSFIWGVSIAILIIFLGNFILSMSGIVPIDYSLEINMVILFFSITTGLYFASFWSGEDNSQAILLGFSTVIFLSVLVIFYTIKITDILIAIGFIFGFSFVRSGAIEKSFDVIIYLKKFFKKITWYIMGLQVTVSYEVPLFNKILNTKNYLSINFLVGIIIAVLFIAFVVAINKYIKVE